MPGPGSSAGDEPRHGLRRLGFLAACALVVVLMALVLPFAQETRWTHLCAEQGGHLERVAGDVEPLLAPQSHLEYVCYGPSGQVLDKW